MAKEKAVQQCTVNLNCSKITLGVHNLLVRQKEEHKGPDWTKLVFAYLSTIYNGAPIGCAH